MIARAEMPPVHPAAAELPLLQGEEFERFAADVAEHGLREPIVMFEGQILDGRNRWRACAAKGIEPRTVEWDGKGSLVAYVMSANLHRRHLDKSQQALVGARLMPLLEAEAKERQIAGGELAGRGRPKDVQVVAHPIAAGRARDKAAELVGVSHTMIDAAVEVLRDAPPEVLAAVEEGRMKVTAAVKKIRASRAPAKKTSLVSLNPKARQILADSSVDTNNKTLMAIARMPSRAQVQAAHLLATGEAASVADAKKMIVDGAVVTPYSRALAAVLALPVEDQRRLRDELTNLLKR